MSVHHVIRVGIPAVLVTSAAVLGWASVNTDGLLLSSASRTGSQTRYTFSGSFTYSYEQNDRTWMASYQATVKARWDSTAGEATESLTYQRLKGEGGEVSARFHCSANPFVAVPGAWPKCQQTGLQVDAPGSMEGASYWTAILEKTPLTFRRADPAAAQALIAKSSSTPPPPPPPAPTPSPKPLPGDKRSRTAEAGAAMAAQFTDPEWRGRRIDFCLHWGTDCGQPAADEFCKRSGYTRSTAWKPALKVGPTLVLGDSKTCTDPGCDGFSVVSCVK